MKTLTEHADFQGVKGSLNAFTKQKLRTNVNAIFSLFLMIKGEAGLTEYGKVYCDANNLVLEKIGMLTT